MPPPRYTPAINQCNSLKWTNNIFLNIGIGIAYFARKHKNLYHYLFLKNNKYKKLLDKFYHTTDIQMKKDRVSEFVTEEGRKQILNKMWIFTHGLSTLISSGLFHDESNGYIQELLEETGGQIIMATIYKNNPERFDKLIKRGKKL